MSKRAGAESESAGRRRVPEVPYLSGFKWPPRADLSDPELLLVARWEIEHLRRLEQQLDAAREADEAAGGGPKGARKALEALGLRPQGGVRAPGTDWWGAALLFHSQVRHLGDERDEEHGREVELALERSAGDLCVSRSTLVRRLLDVRQVARNELEKLRHRGDRSARRLHVFVLLRSLEFIPRC